LLIYRLEPKLTSNVVKIILANARMNVQLNIQLSQGGVATHIRRCVKFYFSFLNGSFRNTTVKKILKSVHIGLCQSYLTINFERFFVAHVVEK